MPCQFVSCLIELQGPLATHHNSQFDPVHFDPVHFDPVHFDPVQFDPVQFDPEQFDPGKSDPEQFDPVQYVTQIPSVASGTKGIAFGY